MVNSLVEKYSDGIAPAMNKRFSYDSVMGTPRIDKIILDTGVGNAVSNAKNLDEAVEELTLISSQKPLIIRVKESIAGFRLHEGMSIDARVTLRGDKMYDFLYKLISVSLPRIRGFCGVGSRSFDNRGNHALGIKEQLIFPGIDYDKVNRVRDLDVVIVTTADTDEEARELLTEFDMPFVR